jgi:endonuclease/exonuclease/phosphatase (EEP) superfamily protein YafD
MPTITVIHINCQNFEQSTFEPELRALMHQKPDFVLLNEVLAKHPLYKSLLTELSGYKCWFFPRQTHWAAEGIYTHGEPAESPWGNMILWNSKRFVMKQAHTEFTHGKLNSFDQVTPDGLPVNIMGIKVMEYQSQDEIAVLNTHGFYGGCGFGKGDCKERVHQTREWLKFSKNIGSGKLIFGGDFNLNIESESLWDLEAGLGAFNPIRKLCIPTTRTRLYPESKRAVEPHASYILSRGFDVKCFKVLTSSLLSDHAPLIGVYSW